MLIFSGLGFGGTCSMQHAASNMQMGSERRERSEIGRSHQACNQIVNNAASYEQQIGREGSNCKASRSRYHASPLGPIRRTMCQLDQSSLEAFCDASLVGGWEEEPTNFFLATHEVDCCSYPPSCPAVSLLVVLVLHKGLRPSGTLSGFPLNHDYPPPPPLAPLLP
jgi:hypothetical protein